MNNERRNNYKTAKATVVILARDTPSQPYLCPSQIL